MPLSRWPTLARLGAVPYALWRARHNAAPRRAFVVTASLQLALLAVLALVSAARPYDGIWLRLAAATWCLWLWPLARLGLMLARLTACLTLCAPRRAARERSIAAVAEELDRLNPEAPDVFRTAMRPEAHAPATRDALEDLYARWEPRLRIPAPPRVFGADRGGTVRRIAVGAALALFLSVLSAPVWVPASVTSLTGGPGALLARMILPLRVLAAIPAPRLAPDDLPLFVAQGDTLVVAVEVEHVPAHRPVHARIHPTGAGPDGEVRYELTPSGPGVRLFRYGPVTGDFTVRFTALRTSTRAHPVTVVAPPRLESFSAVITPPAYTGLPRETRDIFPEALSVLPGTRLEWTGTADRVLDRWDARWSDHTLDGVDDRNHDAGDGGGDSDGGAGGGQAASRTGQSLAAGSGANLRFAHRVRAAGSVQLALTDRAARGGGRSVSGPWRVAVRADRPPELALLAPAGDGELPRSLKVPILFRATDDFGVAAVRLHYALRDAHGLVKAEGTRDVSDWRDPRDGRGLGTWDGASRDALPVAPVAGESVELFLEALDNNAVSGPSRTRSATIRLHLPSREEARAALDVRTRDAATGLTSALEREKRRETAAARPDRAAAAEAALPVATEWDVRRVLSDAPRHHARALGRQVARELELARVAAPEQVAALEALQEKVAALERRIPEPNATHAPVAEQQKLLEKLREDQRVLERALTATPPPPSSPPPSSPRPSAGDDARRDTAPERAERAAHAEEQAARENRRRLEAELQANQMEQEQLQGWLQDQQRAEAAEQARREAAARQGEQARQDLESALKQVEQAMRAGIEDGTLAPDVLEKMDRIRELLDDVLDEQEKEAWRHAADDKAPTPEDLRRAMDDMTRKGGVREELEQAIRMLEAVRDLRTLRDLAEDLRTLEDAQRALARDMAQRALARDLEETDPPPSDAASARQAGQAGQAGQDEAADLAARQEDLARRLEQNVQTMQRLADKPSMDALKRESLRAPSRDALHEMERARDNLKKKRPDREQGQASANLAAQKLAAAAAAMEQALARMDQGAQQTEIRDVLEETLEFTRWLEGPEASGATSWNVGDAREDAQAVARVAHWLAGRMAALADAHAFESDVLRRVAASMTAQADALATVGSAKAVADVRRQARSGARELLKWLNQPQGAGGSDEGDGQGDNDFGGGDQGEGEQEGTQGMASRMRGVSGQQMAANRMTQDLLRSLMEERRHDQGEGGGAPDPSGDKPGDQNGSSGRSPRDGMNGQMSSGRGGGPASRGSGDPEAGQGPDGASSAEGAESGGASGSQHGRGAAANAQQEVANALESMAERADDAGGAARALRRLAEEARALERALRRDRLDPEEIRRRQEGFRTRLLESADAMEERGHRQERRAEVWAGGFEAPVGLTALPVDSLAAELRRRRENARRLPLTPAQKRRVEWYYERLLGE